MSLGVPAICKTTIISSSNGFFWWSVAIKSWIPCAIHCIQLFLYSCHTKGSRTRSICQELELIWCFILLKLLSHFQSRRFHKQAGFYASPGHHVMRAELQILVCISPVPVAFMTFFKDHSKVNALLTCCFC